MKRQTATTLCALAFAAVAWAAAAAEVVEVTVENRRFVPERVTVKPGTTVRWVNREKRDNHSVLFPGEGLESERFFPGESWERTFDRPGIYRYVCGPHPDMTGTVEVAP